MSPVSLVQSIDYGAIAPPLAVAVAALAVLVIDVFLPAARREIAGWAALAGLAVAALFVGPLWRQQRATLCVSASDGLPLACSYVADQLTVVFQLLTLAGAAVVVLLSLDTVRASRIPAGEFFFLLLCSVTGALVLPASRDLLTLLVALELVSLPTFALIGLRRFDGRSSEAALKFFLISVVSTALMLFGLSLVYGVTGQVHLGRIAAALGEPGRDGPAGTVGVVLAVAGFGFKVAAVPFHFWAPDTYVGAPVPVAAYLSVVSKAAGFAGLLLLLVVGFPSYAEVWAPALAVVAALTMTVGNLVALRQRHAVRLLAWSSVAQSGYMLAPLGAAAGVSGVVVLRSTVAYVLAYAVMNLAAFAVVTLVGRHRPSNRLADYRGLARTEPLTAFALAFALACLAGLPPGLLGLFAKVAVFRPPVAGGAGWLAVVMGVNVIVGLAYYLSWAADLFVPPDVDMRRLSYRMSWSDGLAVGVTLGAALALSVLPDVVLGALG